MKESNNGHLLPLALHEEWPEERLEVALQAPGLPRALAAGHHTGSSSASHRTVRVHSDVVVVPLQLWMFSCLPQDVVSSLEQQFTPMMQAEFSVLVDVLHSPELLFPEGSDARIRCGAFMSK